MLCPAIVGQLCRAHSGVEKFWECSYGVLTALEVLLFLAAQWPVSHLGTILTLALPALDPLAALMLHLAARLLLLLVLQMLLLLAAQWPVAHLGTILTLALNALDPLAALMVHLAARVLLLLAIK